MGCRRRRRYQSSSGLVGGKVENQSYITEGAWKRPWQSAHVVGSERSDVFLGSPQSGGVAHVVEKAGFSRPCTISARAQEFILTEGCSHDGRVTLLESSFVTLVLHTGRTQTVQNPTSVAERPRVEVVQRPRRPSSVLRKLGVVGRSAGRRVVCSASADVEMMSSLPQMHWCGAARRVMTWSKKQMTLNLFYAREVQRQTSRSEPESLLSR